MVSVSVQIQGRELRVHLHAPIDSARNKEVVFITVDEAKMTKPLWQCPCRGVAKRTYKTADIHCSNGAILHCWQNARQNRTVCPTVEGTNPPIERKRIEIMPQARNGLRIGQVRQVGASQRDQAILIHFGEINSYFMTTNCHPKEYCCRRITNLLGGAVAKRLFAGLNLPFSVRFICGSYLVSQFSALSSLLQVLLCENQSTRLTKPIADLIYSRLRKPGKE